MKSRTAKTEALLKNAEKLQGLITTLLAMNDIEIVYDFKQQDHPDYLNNIMERQEAIQEEIDDLARSMDTLMGRQIKFPMADSYAYYIITRVDRQAGLVEITWIRYCDAWVDSRAGQCSNLNLEYAQTEVKGQDSLRELFSKVPVKK